LLYLYFLETARGNIILMKYKIPSLSLSLFFLPPSLSLFPFPSPPPSPFLSPLSLVFIKNILNIVYALNIVSAYANKEYINYICIILMYDYVWGQFSLFALAAKRNTCNEIIYRIITELFMSSSSYLVSNKQWNGSMWQLMTASCCDCSIFLTCHCQKLSIHINICTPCTYKHICAFVHFRK